MFRYRFWMLLAAFCLTLGPLLGTAGYGLYLRSSLHADRIAQHVSTFLGVPVQIGSVVPLDTTSQSFAEVAVWLPGEFAPLFYCQQATMSLNSQGLIEMELRDGQIRANTDAWNQGTLTAVLQTAFGHDFQKARVSTIKLINMEILCRRGQTVLRARGATGRIDLAGKDSRIDILCRSLNGQTAAGPISIRCRLQCGQHPLIEHLSLSAEKLPIEALLAAKQDKATDGQHNPSVTTQPREQTTDNEQRSSTGWITAEISYHQKTSPNASGRIEVAGELSQVDLAAITARFSREPLAGTLSCAIDKAVFDADGLRSAQGHMHVDDLQIGNVLAAAGWPRTEGVATLDLREVRIEDGQVKALLAGGELHDVDLEPVLRKACGGTITGRLSAEITKVRVLDNRLDEVAAQLRMVPPADGGTVDQAVLAAALQRVSGIELPAILPEKIAYTDLGARLRGADNDLYIQGIAGPDDEYLLVADVPPAPIPLIAQPAEPLSLQPLQEFIASRLDSLLVHLSPQ